jgi:hypothetical protein
MPMKKIAIVPGALALAGAKILSFTAHAQDGAQDDRKESTE